MKKIAVTAFVTFLVLLPALILMDYCVRREGPANVVGTDRSRETRALEIVLQQEKAEHEQHGWTYLGDDTWRCDHPAMGCGTERGPK